MSRRALFVLAWVAMLATASVTVARAQPGDPNLPPLSREWRGPDYQAAAAAIASGRVALPTSGSALLARITAPENLAFPKDQSQPLQARLLDVAYMLQGLGSIVIRYAEAADGGRNVHAEIAAVVAYSIRTAGLTARLTDEFVPTIPKDERYAARMQALARMRSGAADVMLGAEGMLAHFAYFNEEDTTLLTAAMAESLPALKSLLAADVRAELRSKLEARRRTTRQPGVIENIDRMLAEL